MLVRLILKSWTSGDLPASASQNARIWSHHAWPFRAFSIISLPLEGTASGHSLLDQKYAFVSEAKIKVQSCFSASAGSSLTCELGE